MRKFILAYQLLPLFLLSSSIAFASGGGGHDREHWGKHHRHHEAEYYPPAPYYAPQPVYRDPRSHQGLAGGVVGSVLGYELGNGNPLATGVGAAAGAMIGNGVSGRR